MSLTFTNILRSHRKYLCLIKHAPKPCINFNHIPRAQYFLTPLYLSEDMVRIVGKGLIERIEAENMAMQEKKKLLSVATVQDHGVEHDVYKLIDNEEIGRQKTEKENKNVKMKTMTFKADISKNDLQRKSKQVSGFLEKGYRVVIRISRQGFGTTSPKKAFEGMLSFLTVEVKIQLKADQQNVYSCELSREEVE